MNKTLTVAALLPLLVAAAPAPSASPADTMQVASRDGANLQRPKWSPDGKLLSYEANFHDDKRIELYVGSPDPKVVSAIGAPRFTRVLPAVSPSSSLTAGFSKMGTVGEVAYEISFAPPTIGRFVYSASNDLQDYDLYISGGGAITSVPGADGGPEWSPNGHFIAFTSARTGEGDLYLIDVNNIGNPPRRLTDMNDSSELYITWSPDSTKLAFVGHSHQGDNLWLIPGLGDEPIRLTDWTGSQTRPTFSPNGRWVAFYANLENADRMDLYIVEPRQAATPRMVVKGVVPNAHGPAWTPDGDHLVTVLDQDDKYDPIALVEAKQGDDAQILDLGTVGNGDLDVVKGADGRAHLAWVAQGRAKDDKRDFRRLFVATLPPIPPASGD